MVRCGARIIAFGDMGQGGTGREATSSDGGMRILEEMAVDGFSELRIEMPEVIRAFHKYRKDITSADGQVLYRDKG